MTCVPWKRIHVDRPLLLSSWIWLILSCLLAWTRLLLLWLTARMAPLIPRVRLVLLVLSPCIWLILPPLISRICLLLLLSSPWISPLLPPLLGRISLLLLLIALRLLISWHLVRLLRG